MRWGKLTGNCMKLLALINLKTAPIQRKMNGKKPVMSNLVLQQPDNAP